MDTGEPQIAPARTPSASPAEHALLAEAARRKLPRAAQVAIVAVLALVVIGGVLAGPALYRLGSPTPAAEQPAAAAPEGTFRPTDRQWAGLKIVPIQTMPFQDSHQTDGLIAIDDDLTTPVFSPYSGRVTKLFAKAGDTVAAGAPLLGVQATEFVQAQNDLVAAAATLKTARAQLALSQTNEKRAHDLYLAQGGALKDWQQSQVDLANAQGGLASTQIALGAVRNRLRILGKSETEISALEAGADSLSFDPQAIVRAPIGGTIINRQVGPGQNIVSAASGATTPVFQIGDLSTVWLVANARESDAASFHVGDPVEVTVPAYPGRTFRAKLDYVAPSIDPNTHRLPVRAAVESTDGALKPQMFASFSILGGNAEAAPAVPEDAIIYEADTARVWIARPDKTLELRTFTPGHANGTMVEAVKGISAGEQVVTAGSVFIDRAAQGD